MQTDIPTDKQTRHPQRPIFRNA